MKTKLPIIGVLLFTLCFSLFASSPEKNEGSKVDWKKAELNYTSALHSNNFGVRHSAVGYIGEYRLEGAVNDLVTLLRSDKIEKIRMAAALALVKIGKEEARKAVEEASIYDGSEKVAKFCEGLIAANSKDISVR